MGCRLGFSRFVSSHHEIAILALQGHCHQPDRIYCQLVAPKYCTRPHCLFTATSHTHTVISNVAAHAQLNKSHKAHDWLVSVLGPLFRTAGHVVRTQHGVTASAGQRRCDVEIRNYLRDQAGGRSLVFDLSIAHDRFGSSSHVQQNGCLSHPQDLDAPLRIAAQR